MVAPVKLRNLRTGGKMGKGTISLIAVGVIVVAGGCVPGLRENGPKIQTSFASYGYAMNRKDVKEDVMKYCDGKTSCSFKVTNENLASKQPLDPSPGDDKGLMIGWKCGDKPDAKPEKEQFAQGKEAKISCK